jgi:UDP-GlcNAc3NAcA epimerase
MKKIITIIGARPQIIKAAAISRAIKNYFDHEIEEILLHTGQHFDKNMSDTFFEELEIPQPKYNLNIHSAKQGEQTALMTNGIEEKLLFEKPDALILYGDTNSTLAGAIAAAKLHIPIVHIEAGLRSFNKKMPEEINRIVADHCATLLFSPSISGMKNLANEGFNLAQKSHYSVDEPGVFHCGDIMYDNSLYFAEKKGIDFLQQQALEAGNYFLTTIHRPQNTDDQMRLTTIFETLIQLAEKEEILFVLPLHPRTKKILQAKHPQLWEKLNKHSKVRILAPASYLEMICLENHAQFVVTDSGGVQKEAFFFKKPSLILRSETEWVEICENNNAQLVDADKERIFSGVEWIKNNASKSYPALFGDGNAAVFICTKILQFLNQ